MVQKARSMLAQYEAAQTQLPPTSGPKAATGKFVVVIPAAMAYEGSAREANGSIAAANAIGWKSLLLDPNGDAATEAQDIETAVAQKADGIVLDAIDPASVSGPLSTARAAGIKIIVVGGPDATGKLTDASVPGPSVFIDDGQAEAWYLISALNGKGNIALFEDPESPSLVERVDGFKSTIKQCPDCHVVVDTTFLSSTLLTTFPQTVASTLRTHPNINAIMFPYDAATALAEPALKADGLLGNIIAVSGDGNSQNIGFVKSNTFQAADVALPLEWEGWGAVDDLNRMFNGTPAVDENVAFRLLVASNVNEATTSSNAYNGSADYEDAYCSSWGASC
jgi:ribose transport system substrate-binding protein